MRKALIAVAAAAVLPLSAAVASSPEDSPQVSDCFVLESLEVPDTPKNRRPCNGNEKREAYEAADDTFDSLFSSNRSETGAQNAVYLTATRGASVREDHGNGEKVYFLSQQEIRNVVCHEDIEGQACRQIENDPIIHEGEVAPYDMVFGGDMPLSQIIEIRDMFRWNDYLFWDTANYITTHGLYVDGVLKTYSAHETAELMCTALSWNVDQRDLRDFIPPFHECFPGMATDYDQLPYVAIDGP